jgi:tRNA dimethylallyltransferase
LSLTRVVAIVGPTASGKSALAMEVAQRLGGEIISCDSVQVYRGLDIGSGKASASDRAQIRHHLVDTLDLDEEMNAAMFAEQAGEAIENIAARGRLPLVVGGTGLYLTALLKGLFEQGEPSLDTRERLMALAARHGSARLHRLLEFLDPDYAARTQASDLIRVVRALEVCFASGRPFSEVQRERRPTFQGKSLLIGLDPGRASLRDRVTARVSRMIAEGLIEETSAAIKNSSGAGRIPRPLGAIGYREVAAGLAKGPPNALQVDELQRAIVTATMQYAKRQMTYFRRQFEVEWFSEPAPALVRIGEWIEEGGVGKR